jgi:predicted nucleic acid-binding protein
LESGENNGGKPERLLKAYADSSFLVSLYLQQEHSRSAAAFMQSHGWPMPFTPWHRLEVRNALRLAVFQGLIDNHQARTQLKQLDTDLREESLIRHEPVDWLAVLRRAEQIGSAHHAVIGCRSSDLFHIAAAAVMEADQFVTYDARQKEMARAAGLKV